MIKTTKYSFYTIIFFACFSLILPAFGGNIENNKDFGRFLDILGKVESNNNDYEVGDNGRAISRYQIWEVCYKDAKQFDKTIDFPYYSLTNKVNAQKVVKSYLNRYSKTDNIEEWARLWNGGCNWKKKTGQAKKNLDIYWLKIKKNI